PPVASTLSISTTFAKEHLSLALLAPPVAPPLHPHNLLKSTSILHPAPSLRPSPLIFPLFIIQHSFPPCIPLTTSADNSIIKAVTSIST
ncbi:hypothetical protein ABHB17_13420, partial [[Eubacterium] siraeum]